MDYVVPGRRKTKGDKRAKGRYARYKSGGRFRSSNIVLSNKISEENNRKKKRKK